MGFIKDTDIRAVAGLLEVDEEEDIKNDWDAINIFLCRKYMPYPWVKPWGFCLPPIPLETPTPSPLKPLPS